jgi:acetate kinase
MEWMGIELDAAANERSVGGVEGVISAADARLPVWVIPTDEELVIARDAFRVVTGVEGRF